MPPQSAATAGSSLDASAETVRRLQNRSLLNLSRMGHCAPTIMKTLLDVSSTSAQWLVKLAAGLPGGIGNTGGECGGVTAPLVLLGLRHGFEAKDQRLPLIVYKGHDLLRRFTALHGTTSCREIRGHQRVPLRCISVVRQAPALCVKAACSNCAGSLSGEREAAYGRLYSHWVAAGFHCAHAVFRDTGGAVPATGELLDATAGFMGGTVFTGMTCSALTAGVMALGLAQAEIENSRLRVLRMIGTMAIGGDAFADKLNAFNKTMNLGHRLSRWFAAEHGSTQCRAITHCDFSTTEGVQRYIENGGTMRCRAIAQSVARRVQNMLQSAG
jgi:C_GCAxxG_C_C family probable redox protein